MEIELANRDDVQGIAEVHVRSWQGAYKGIFADDYLISLSAADRAAMWMQIIEEKSAQVLVAKQSTETIGFVSFSASRDADAAPQTFEIQAIYVAPKNWSTGVGHQLMQKALTQIHAHNKAKTITLWVLTGNIRAIRFYNQAGFAHDDGVSKTTSIGGATVKEQRFFKMV